MKIGLITLSASYNCGSMLQCFALKTLLSEYGNVEVINFSSKKSHAMYDFVPKCFLKKALLEKRTGLLKELKEEVQAYESFKSQQLGISGEEFFANDLHKQKDKYDVVVAGSDQVWNVLMSDFDEAFFCGWSNAKKVAYAPSLGGCDVRKSPNAPQVIEWIKQFDFLSVREEIGKRCLEEVTGRKVEKILDPTLVIPVEKWKELVGEPIIDEDYIFEYSWAYCDAGTRQIVADRSSQTGLPVYVLDAHKWRTHKPEEDGFILCKEAGPLAFLNLMYYAKECFVESFHGMLFAYMFEKNFWLLDTHQNYNELDSRLKELVELVGAKNRLVTKYNVSDVDFNVPFEYSNNALLVQGRKKSIEYLESVFKGL